MNELCTRISDAKSDRSKKCGLQMSLFPDNQVILLHMYLQMMFFLTPNLQRDVLGKES